MGNSTTYRLRGFIIVFLRKTERHANTESQTVQLSYREVVLRQCGMAYETISQFAVLIDSRC
ncbi:unnamed protein product [Chondrus crispus]|uniref:Uncharacterized protein n=1 Tax=Chondrus crispus TaxID=2769 RepID=R7QGT6_CHOCR|nr:unnamed protein product [Chondrus crispus]CDF36676.1 unnamed protein product [Chondrus crispus]|eukprot:XP_005716495.1 unnamed protein product [Chondrus crispus]